MSARGNFFRDRYHWLALAAGVLALAGAAYVYLQGTDETPDDVAADALGRIRRANPQGEPAKAADMTDFNRALGKVKKPDLIIDITDAGESFLASEKRVFCENAKCGKPIPAGVTNCPACGFVRIDTTPKVSDTDGDGMTDVWEKKYGLNPDKPDDANADADNDGFTNLEEFTAETDPKDPKSHPDYLDSLTIALPLKTTTLPFYFLKMEKVPAGMRYYFKSSKAKSDDWSKGSSIVSVLVGEEIGKSGFVVKSHEKKSERRKIGGSQNEREVDVSTATLERKQDGKLVTVRIGERGKAVDMQARLVYSRGGGREFTVVTGDEIALNGVKYRIKDIRSAEKRVTVAIAETVGGKLRTIEALEP